MAFTSVHKFEGGLTNSWVGTVTTPPIQCKHFGVVKSLFKILRSYALLVTALILTIWFSTSTETGKNFERHIDFTTSRWVIFSRRRDRGVVCAFCTFDAGESVCACMCWYTNTYAHTARGLCDVSPGVGTTHLKALKYPDRLNLVTYVFVYADRVHMCIYMLGGGMRSELTAFFL